MGYYVPGQELDYQALNLLSLPSTGSPAAIILSETQIRQTYADGKKIND